MREPSRFLVAIPPALLELAVPRMSSYRSPDRYSSGYDDSDNWSNSRPSPPARAYRIEPDYSSDPEPAWKTEPQRDLEPPEPVVRREPSFQKGEAVAHQAFGQGLVLESKIVGDDEQVTVLFKGHPTPKKLSLSFAPLQRV